MGSCACYGGRRIIGGTGITLICCKSVNYIPQDKPHPSDINDIFYPDVAIRISLGGIQHIFQFCLDFIDVTTRASVNTPKGFELRDVHHPGTYSYGGQLLTLEKACRVVNVPDGDAEGSRVALKRVTTW